MAKTMLIDATHPEETRVAVVDGRKLEEFDVEISGRRALKGNIYLAKVTRVEPSLQACFVEYGGNRHGFLAFSEIHPDYYRIPVADREALLRAAKEDTDDHDEERRRPRRRRDGREGRAGRDQAGAGAAGTVSAENAASIDQSGQADEHAHRDHDHPDHAGDEYVGHDGDHAQDHDHPDHDHAHHDHGHQDDGYPDDGQPAAIPLAVHHDVLRDQRATDTGFAGDAAAVNVDDAGASDGYAPAPQSGEPGGADSAAGSMDSDLPPPAHGEIVEVPVSEEVFDTVGGEEPANQDDPEVDEENARRRRQRALRRYKIQEVIKRRQILLVQVTKEERGNKGAALTTYLSLAGRYCVLMPNTDRGGGISRRITNPGDRKRLKGILDELDTPEGMAVIVRTAGGERSKPEVKRDFEYLFRLWDEIRETTLKSTAPALIYEEASLIKRSIRDLYTRDIGDIVVAGVEDYKQAKAFMRMLTPSHAKRVQLYRDTSIPLFQRFQIESQIAAIHNPVVQLRSGGYIVLNQTEALVAIDVNSGRSTKERNIEETALRTNLEAAEEVARQLRLRDLAGLIVIDFIDMEEHRNNAAVERKIKDALRNDRARIQIGRISSFGLLEMSRQRLHPSLQEASTELCPHCAGTGRIRSVDSTALHVLRMVEEEITKSFSPGITVFVPAAVALYILNQKRVSLSQLEIRRGVRIYLQADESLIPPDFRIDRIRELAPGEELPPPPPPALLPLDEESEAEDEAAALEAEESEAESESESESDADGDTEAGGEAREGAEADRGGRQRKRRRRRGRGNRFSADEFTEKNDNAPSAGQAPARDYGEAAADAQSGEAPRVIPISYAADEPRGIDSQAGDGSGTDQSGDFDSDAEGEEDGPPVPGQDGDQPRRRRRRGRRGGRRRSRRGTEGGAEGAVGENDNQQTGYDNEAPRPAYAAIEPSADQPDLPDDPSALPPHWQNAAATAQAGDVTGAAESSSGQRDDGRRRRSRKPRTGAEPSGVEPTGVEPTGIEPIRNTFPAAEPARETPRNHAAAEAEVSPPVQVIEAVPAGAPTDADAAGDDAQQKRRGWWRRLIE